MAMMMTGRVLLVCALCVLWCGVCGGGCSETPPDSPDNPSDDQSLNEEEPTGVTGQGDQSAKQEVPKATAPKASESPEVPSSRSPAQPPGGGASVTPSTTTDSKDQNAQEYKKEEEDEQEEEEDDDKKEKGDTRKEEAATGTAEGTSAGGQEQPSISYAAEGASNITNPNSTQTTGDIVPAADGAGTREEKQSDNKDANPKETPVEATAMKTTTATTGDSDGSTAVSHTTSPLLLLLVVACAAAAAVVAA
ncbi:mucin-associated surface protein (MASP) [Trypanosoma cruzi Dm28c]|uniref:Mucin-associated surface protein (MASP) n=2 Tax=Trypanosoma cruzi TaxID=5693 RepID=V5B2I4_TRYCR|nr:mucin-associated surface protein (MASP) [Trypanosoma cruzi Dm28c]PBJ70954.1 mucin-associated surface protein [Trypanosoma cruzi cruzi]PWV01827.1 Mucin-associated surface protein (MASP) [Trypanosoma cruzi]